MPDKIYMEIDNRHDHGLRVPRPDLSASHNTPNPCSQCHQLEEILTDALTTRLAPWTQHYANTFVMDNISAEHQLVALANDSDLNAIVRATALSRIAQGTSGGAARAIATASQDQNPLVRHSAIAGIHQLPPKRLIGSLKRLLDDSTLAVRIEAARQALQLLNEQQRRPLEPNLGIGIDEYITSQLLFAERAEANVNLASVYLRTSKYQLARTHLETALEINPSFIPALLNYADLLRQLGQDQAAQQHLLTAVNLPISAPEADYAYALWLVRNGTRELALVHLKRAVDTEPDNPRWVYAYAIGLHSMGQGGAAIELLRSIQEQPFYQTQLMFLHATIARDLAGTDVRYRVEALALADRLVTLEPGEERYQELLRELSR